jgi:hypothetical protein
VLRVLTVPLAVSLVALAAGCGEVKIDSGKAEGLAKKVAGTGTIKLTSATCPDNVKAKKGADFNCDLVYADGTKGTITIHQQDDTGSIRTAGTDIRIQGQ